MKKFIIATALTTTAMIASAADVGLSTVHDFTVDKTGIKVSGSAYNLNLSATHVDGAYTRYAVAKEATLTKLGPVSVGASLGGVYQNTHSGVSGYGFTAGLKATYPVTKSVTVTAGLDRFFGQERIEAYNGAVTSVGVSVKF